MKSTILKPLEILTQEVLMVPRGRIELPTQGFSNLENILGFPKDRTISSPPTLCRGVGRFL